MKYLISTVIILIFINNITYAGISTSKSGLLSVNCVYETKSLLSVQRLTFSFENGVKLGINSKFPENPDLNFELVGNELTVKNATDEKVIIATLPLEFSEKNICNPKEVGSWRDVRIMFNESFIAELKSDLIKKCKRVIHLNDNGFPYKRFISTYNSIVKFEDKINQITLAQKYFESYANRSECKLQEY